MATSRLAQCAAALVCTASGAAGWLWANRGFRLARARHRSGHRFSLHPVDHGYSGLWHLGAGGWRRIAIRSRAPALKTSPERLARAPMAAHVRHDDGAARPEVPARKWRCILAPRSGRGRSADRRRRAIAHSDDSADRPGAGSADPRKWCGAVVSGGVAWVRRFVDGAACALAPAAGEKNAHKSHPYCRGL